MKMKHLILVSLMLVILTMGVVSASEDVCSEGNLTTDDCGISDNEDIISAGDVASSEDEGIVSAVDVASSEDELIASGDEREDAVEINIYGYNRYSKTWLTVELGGEDTFASIHAPEDATGNITVFVNNVQCFNKEIFNCYSSFNDDDNLVYYIGLQDLDYEFSLGKYHTVITYDGDENYLPTYESNTIKVVEENSYVDSNQDAVEITIYGYDNWSNEWHNTELDGESSFAEIYAPENATGSITVFVNGTQCFKKDISDCRPFIDNWGNIAYCICLQDVDYEFSLGKYNVEIVYGGDGYYLSSSKNNVVRIVEEGYDDDGQDEVDIFICESSTLDEGDYFAVIYASEYATGNVTVFVNGTQCFKKDISNCSKFIDEDIGFAYRICLQDVDYEFSLGEYYVEIFYDGDKYYYPTIESKDISIVEKDSDDEQDAVEIIIYESVILDDDDCFAMIDAPDDATGNVTVFVNGTQCFKEDLSNCPKFSDEDDNFAYRIGPQDVDYEFSLGKYHVEIFYDGDEVYSPTAVSNDVMVEYDSDEDGQNYVEIYICESFTLKEGDYFAEIHAPKRCTGNIAVFVNGTQCFKNYIYKCRKGTDEYGNSVYLIGPQDVDYDFYPGEYFVEIVYDGNKYYSPTSESSTVLMDDGNHDDGPDDEELLEVEIYIYGCGKDDDLWDCIELNGFDYFASINAPKNATGNVTVFVDGIQCFNEDISKCSIFDEAKEYFEYQIGPQDLDYDFSPGWYFVKIVYDGDQYHSPVSESNVIRLVEEGYDEYGRDGVEIVIYGYEDTKLDGTDCFAIIHAPQEGLTGNITVFVNGTQCLKGEVSKCLSDSSFYESKFCIGPQDVDYVFSPGKYSVKIVYDGNRYYFPTSGTGIITIIGDNNTHVDGNSHGVVDPSGGAASAVTKNPVSGVVVKKDTVKLTLKKVKVKRSAKKLILQATLKINNKAKKGLKVIFRFNGKKFTTKTNKKGIAKVTIKKSVLKKLKIGKKVKIQVSYGTTTKNLVVKIKK